MKARAERMLDMTVGSPARLLARFAFPLFLGNLLQQIYNLADTAIAGHMLGDAALTQIGASAALYSLITNLAFGMNNGLALPVSRHFGAKDSERLWQSVAWTVILSGACAALLTVVFLLFRFPILRALHTPEDMFSGAMDYLLVILAGIPLTMAYNLEASLLQAVGNSRTPLLLLLFSSVLNIALDILFMGPLQIGVGGAAIATILSQGVSAVLGFLHICRHYPELKFGRAALRVPRGFVADLFMTGLSMSLMTAIYNIGSVMLQGSINELGSAYIAAQITARRMAELIYTPGLALGMAVATYSSQNYGAQKRSRIAQGVKTAILLYGAWWAIAMLLTFTLGAPTVRLISGSSDETVLSAAVQYLYISIPMIPPMAILVILRSMMQGIRRRISPLICSAVEMIGKIVFALWIVPAYGYIAVCVCEPVTWVACCAMICIAVWRCRSELRDGAVHPERIRT